MITTSSTEKATFQFSIFSEDQIEEIKWAAFDVMRTAGFKVYHPEARKMLKQAGAVVRGESVKVPDHIVRECIRLAPKGWTIFNRNGQRAMEIQGRKSYFGTSTASPNTHDIVTGTVRPTQLEDIGRGARLADALEHIDFVMPFGSSQDVPGEACDIYEFPEIVANTVKPIVFIGYSGRGVELVYEMAAAAVGGLDNLQERPYVIAYPESIAPMVFPQQTVDRIFAAASLNMPQIPCADIQLGATGPVTIAGAIVQALVEGLMGLVLAQLKKPGCPVCLATTIGILDMSRGLMTFGAPTNSTALCAHAEVARSFGLPTWGLAGATDAKGVDAQSGAETAFHILAQALAGLNLIHDVGYIDSAMTCSAHQMVFGNEVIGMVKHFMKGITVNRETLAREVIASVGPGGNFLEHQHTFDHFKDELWFPEMMNRQSRGDWESNGARDMATISAEETTRILGSHEPQRLDGRIIDTLADIRIRGEKELLSRS